MPSSIRVDDSKVLVVIATVLVTTIAATPLLYADASKHHFPQISDTKAPSVVSGDNVYVAWWTNKAAGRDKDVLFRASNDGGATFGNQ